MWRSSLRILAVGSSALLALSTGGCASGHIGGAGISPDGGTTLGSNIDAGRTPPPYYNDDAAMSGARTPDAARTTRVDAAPGAPHPDAFLPLPPPPDAAPNPSPADAAPTPPPPDAAPTPPPDAPPSCNPTTIDLFQNGNFDSGPGNPPWFESSAGGFEMIATESDFGFPPDTGNFAAWLAGYNNANDGLAQAVSVPAGATNLKLNGKFFFITTEPTPSTQVFDQGGIGVFDTSGNLLETLATFNNTGAVASPSQGSWTAFSLSAKQSYAGQSILIGFVAQTDSVNPTSFFFDSLTLTVTVCQ